MILISKQTAEDAGDNVTIRNYPESFKYDSTARIERVKTLDGGVGFTLGGCTPGDQTPVIKCRVTNEEATVLKALHENNVWVRFSTKDGVYSGLIYSLRIDPDGETEITCYLKETLT